MRNLRLVLGLLIVSGIAFSMSVWRAEIVEAIDLGVSESMARTTDSLAQPAATPPDSEELLIERPDAPNLIATGTLTASDPTFNRPNNDGCASLSGNNTRYDAITFTVTTAGGKTLSLETADGGSITPNGTDGAGPDTFMFLYSGTFNPAAPLTNCSASSDDINGGANRRSRIISTLTPGTYTAVITAFNVAPTTTAGDAALPWTYSLAINGGVTLTVTKTADTNDGVCDVDCSLREAIAAASAGDAIAFSSLFNSAQTIPISLGQIVINKNLTVTGPGANLLTVSGAGNGANRIFNVNSGVTFNLSGVTLTGVNAPGINGGAISNSGTLNLSNSTVRLNAANNGGGIFNFSTLSIVGSTFSANSSGPGGGGGVFNQGTLTISNSTFSGNAAAGNGGGGAISTLAGTATIANTTIAGNFANSGSSGGGILNQATLNLRNSIVANNTSASGGPDINGSVASQGFNLIENTTGATISGTTASNITGIDPGLGALANNGGPTLTHALLGTSPAIDKGSNSGSPLPTTDQRGSGFARTVDLAIANASGGDGTDIGAFESATFTDTTAPTAFGSHPNITTAGGSASLTVVYADNVAINLSTINTGDVTVTGPNGFVSTPGFINSSVIEADIFATYSLTPPGGTWDSADNGTYNIVMQAGQVADTSGNFVAAGTIGSFTVNIPDTAAPTASGSAPNVTTAGATLHTATVIYTDNLAINASTVGPGDIRITGPNGFDQPTDFQNVTPGGNGTPRTANYPFPVPGGWTFAKNGTYNIVMQANQVADTSGNFVAAGTIGTFTVNIPDTAVPTATPATAPNVTTSGGTSHTVTVQYNDNVAININTIETGDISVTGPNGFNVTPSWSQTSLVQATVVTATYILTPPGGTWDAADNGTYNIVMQANQVADSSGNFVAAGTVGTFTVNICPTISLGSIPANGRVGVFYNGAATAAPAGTYTYSVTAGSLPTGVNLNTSSGIVSGAPTAGGSSTFTITATDPGACSGSREYTVAISNPPTPTPTPIANADVTEPGDLIVGVAATAGSSTSTASFTGTTAGTNSNPAAEGSSSAIDNDIGTKFLNFAETGVGFIVTPAVHGPQTVVDRLRFTTANDALERDPITVTIEGTNSPNATATLNSTWTTIYNGVTGLATNPGRFNPGSVMSFSNTTAYTSYRVIVTSIRDGAVANSVQFSEIELIGKTAGFALPQTFTVTNLTNDGPGSLRQAILDANANSPAADTINFQAGLTGTILLTSDQLSITDSVTINGPGSSVISVSGNNARRVFDMSGGTTVSISGLTITNGSVSGDGGGIRAFGTLNLSNCAVTNNTATGFSGGIDVNFALTVTNCTISGNSAANGGGIASVGTVNIVGSTISGNTAAFQGGGLNMQSTNSTITNSTISGNTANTPSPNAGGGISFGGSSGSFTLQIRNSTIANNLTATANSCGGLSVVSDGGTNTAILKNTIVAGNAAPNLRTEAVSGGTATITSQGFNLTNDPTNAFLNQSTDQFNTNPLLGPLANNGGMTRTHALLVGSPAIDKGSNAGSGVTTDQRNLQRPRNLVGYVDAIGGDGSDIGAYEEQSEPTAQTLVVTNLNDSGTGSLRQAILNSNATVDAVDTINFQPGLTGTITLTTGELLITRSVTVNGPGAGVISVSGNNASRVIQCTSSSTAIMTISGLTITGGRNLPGSGGGGGIRSGSALTISNSVISGNSLTFGAGGGIFSSGPLTIINSTISGNSAVDDGGGIIFDNTSANFTVSNSTISGNTVTSTNSQGGGIWVQAAAANITNSTITNNSIAGAGSASGLYRNAGSVTLRNTIVAGNQSNSTKPDVFANGGTGITSGGFNLIGNPGSLAIFSQTGDQFGTAGSPLNPLLGPLANNGGPTQTHALLAGSPAIDKGSNSGSPLPTTDQRGQTRTIDLAGIANASGGDGTDIGAFELQQALNTAPTITPQAATRRQGSPASVSTVATVSDSETSPGALTVTVNGGATATVSGVTVGNIVNTNGTITANVVATCAAAAGTVVFTLRVLDGGGLFTDANLSVTVQGNLAPTLSYAQQTVDVGGSLSINPASGPTDLGGIASIVVQNQGTYTGTISVNNTTGVVSVSNAQPAGTHTITIRATDNCGAITNNAFTLNVSAAGSVVVSNTNDSGPGSLRQAIADVSAGGTITFSSLFSEPDAEDPERPDAPQTITLTSGQLLITKAMTINGPGANLLTISGGNSSRVIDTFFSPGMVVNLSGMTITGGNVANGGGGIRNNANMTLTAVLVTGNTTSSAGGGISSVSSLTVIDSTISANTAAEDGGGIISDGTALTVRNSTISGNTVSLGISEGGGIWSRGAATITNSTITNNSAAGQTRTSGIFSAGGSLTMRNTISAANVGNSTNPDTAGTGFVSSGYNLIGNRGAITVFNQPGDQSGTGGLPVNPRLGPLQNNGGTTLTHSLLAGSPAIDAGNSSGSINDQRGNGFLRVVDLLASNNAPGGDAADIGAVELQAEPPAATVTISGNVFRPGGLALGGVRVFLTNSQGVRLIATTSPFGIFSFTNVESGREYFLTVSSKRFRFAAVPLTPTANVTGLVLTGLE